MGDEKPKYINSPDSLVYNKQNHLYAMNFARKEQSKQLIVVEGYMDAIAMHSAGFKNTVAALGTSFTDSQLSSVQDMLKRSSSSLMLIMPDRRRL